MCRWPLSLPAVPAVRVLSAVRVLPAVRVYRPLYVCIAHCVIPVARYGSGVLFFFLFSRSAYPLQQSEITKTKLKGTHATFFFVWSPILRNNLVWIRNSLRSNNS